MNVLRNGLPMAACLVLSLTGASMAREAGDTAPAAKARSKGLHGTLAGPPFTSNLRAGGKDQPYTWPVSDRYQPVSRPYYGRAY